MASNIQTVHLYVTSYHGDFTKEREILFKEVVPDLRAWCESRKLLLVETDVRWGGQSSEITTSILKQIEEHYYVEEMPIFVNISCDTLGLVPIWGQAHGGLAKSIHDKLKVSKEEHGILYGAYREDNPNIFFVTRNDGFIDDLMPEERKYFVDRNMLTDEEIFYANNLLEKVGQSVQYSYNCAGWDPDLKKLVVEIEDTFAKMLLEKLKAIVSRAYPIDHSSFDAFGLMRESHEAFMSTRNLKVKGRDDIVQRIENYIYSGERDVPLLLLGGAGSGKSSIMAKATAHLVRETAANNVPGHGGKGWIVFYHFVGAVPGSTELESMLKRLLRELEVVSESTMPKDLDSAAQLCYGALSNPNTKPILVMVDANNQFDEDAAALIMSWVPRKLAPQVRVVLSMINDSTQHQNLAKRESKPQELHLTPLDVESRRQIVQEMLAQYNKILTRDQMNLLLSKRASENPLWLSIASEELRLIPDSRNLFKRIDDLKDGLLDLLEEVLARFEGESGGQLKVATLCLLEASASGLLERELLAILGNEKDLVPPSPYDEKEEKEDTEKESKGEKKRGPLAQDKWAQVYRSLRPFLRPYGDSHEGRLDFYHRALSKAVRRKYFKKGEENEGKEESLDIYNFWHQKLADYFENCDNVDRKAEEYLYHLARIEDKTRLINCLLEWSMFDKLYSDEYSSQLLSYWRQAGGTLEMISQYKRSLSDLETTEPKSDELIALRHEHVARIFLQAGKYNDSLELAKVALKWEEKELGNQPERMVELYGLMAEIYDEKLKLNDFVSPTQLPDLRKTINYGRKSISLRKLFTGTYHKFKLGMSLMKLAFSLESWDACGGDSELTGEDALREGNEHIDTALAIFKELKDTGHYAEALMTKGVLAPRGSMEQLKHYKEAMEMCMQVYGEYSLLTSRLYINIGIVYEDNCDYVKAYEYFKKWAKVSDIVLGPDHPKTLRAKGVLKEPRYRLVALRLKERSSTEGQNNEDEGDESTINAEVEEMNENEDGYNVDGIDDEGIAEEEDEEDEEGEGNIDNVEGDFATVTDELQQAINELLRRALGGLESNEDIQAPFGRPDPILEGDPNISSDSQDDVNVPSPRNNVVTRHNDSESDSTSGDAENGYSSSSSFNERQELTTLANNDVEAQLVSMNALNFRQPPPNNAQCDNNISSTPDNRAQSDTTTPAESSNNPNGRPPQLHSSSFSRIIRRRGVPLDSANSPLRNLILGNNISIVDSNRDNRSNWSVARDNRLENLPRPAPIGENGDGDDDDVDDDGDANNRLSQITPLQRDAANIRRVFGLENPLSVHDNRLQEGRLHQGESDLFRLTLEELQRQENTRNTRQPTQANNTTTTTNNSRQQQQSHNASSTNNQGSSALQPTTVAALHENMQLNNDVESFRELLQRALSLEINSLDSPPEEPARDNRDGYENNAENSGENNT